MITKLKHTAYDWLIRKRKELECIVHILNTKEGKEDYLGVGINTEKPKNRTEPN